MNSGDLRRIAIHVLKQRPYDARYDINRDGVLDFRDVLAAVRQFGQRC